jgi:K+-transporting ATPase KdpF subunit
MTAKLSAAAPSRTCRQHGDDCEDQVTAAIGGATETTMGSVYILTLLVFLLVIYLFYAVINPQKF